MAEPEKQAALPHLCLPASQVVDAAGFRTAHCCMNREAPGAYQYR